MGKLKRYPNPQKAGAFLLLDDKEAKRLGLTELGEERHAPPAPADEVTEGATPIVVEHGQEKALVAGSETPKGALAPAGPTRRAREQAAQNEALAGLLEVDVSRVEALNAADPPPSYLEITRALGVTMEDVAELGDLERTRAALLTVEARAELSEEDLAERLAPEPPTSEEENVKSTEPPTPTAPAGSEPPKDKATPPPAAGRGGRRRRPAGETPAK